MIFIRRHWPGRTAWACQEGRIWRYADKASRELTAFVGELAGQEMDHILGRSVAYTRGLLPKDPALGPDVGRLDSGDEAVGEAGPQFVVKLGEHLGKTAI